MNLITGINSGLGKYLYKNFPNSVGLNRSTNFEAIKHIKYDTIIHCAFNKETQISDYKKYLNDNIFLTQRLKELKYKKFIYISSVDVYQKNKNIYSYFKIFSETLMDKEDLILRCPMILGNTMKPNHVTKLLNNVKYIGLSGESKFNYILMQDLVDFLQSKDYLKHSGVIDFVSNGSLKLKKLKQILNSKTKLGDYIYNNSLDYLNPIFILNKKYDDSSLNKIKTYFK
tara:strand:+ start:6431 stop:7114 length:684 start_codon:yes stop_codon:yes gene_type:complete